MTVCRSSVFCGSVLISPRLDLIFKNQAVNSDKPQGQFVNDLLRTEFHRSVISFV